MRKKLLLLMLYGFTIPWGVVNAQAADELNYPAVGEPMPDFILRNIAYFPKKEASLKDFRGKWLVLDFWNKSCGACIASFPHVSEMQRELGDKLQVMMVGIQDPERQIQPMYAKYREKENLLMPCAFDSAIAKRFDIYVAPHTIVIDDKGIVRCITSSVNAKDMKGFLSGNPPTLPQTYIRMSDYRVPEEERYSYDPSKPLMIANNGGADTSIMFRSLLSSWDGKFNMQFVGGKIDEYKARQGKFEALGVTLEWLYDYAYFGEQSMNGWDVNDSMHYGEYYPFAILEIKDSSKFKYSYKYSTNIFSYSLILPKQDCTVEKMQAVMQRDLQNYFGFDAAIETRKCPYWKLVATKRTKERLKTKGSPASWEGINKAGFKATNQPFKIIADWIRDAVGGSYFVDATGITGNVDIELDCIPHHIEDIKQALKANGLELVKAEKKMKALVIRDAKKQNSNNDN